MGTEVHARGAQVCRERAGGHCPTLTAPGPAQRGSRGRPRAGSAGRRAEADARGPRRAGRRTPQPGCSQAGGAALGAGGLWFPSRERRESWEGTLRARHSLGVQPRGRVRGSRLGNRFGGKGHGRGRAPRGRRRTGAAAGSPGTRFPLGRRSGLLLRPAPVRQTPSAELRLPLRRPAFPRTVGLAARGPWKGARFIGARGGPGA